MIEYLRILGYCLLGAGVVTFLAVFVPIVIYDHVQHYRSRRRK